MPAISTASPGRASAIAASIAARAIALDERALRTTESAQDHRDDAIGVLAARVVVGDDDAVREPLGRLAHQRTLAGIALAAAAEHDEYAAAGMRAHGRERLRERVGRVRVVDDRERPVGEPVAFHAPGRRGAGAERGERVVHVELPGEQHAERDREVLGIESADQPRAQAPGAEVAADFELEAALGRVDPADVDESPRDRRLAAHGDRREFDAGPKRGGEARADRVAHVDHRVLETGQPEQALLGLGVALHRPVVIEVVAAQVAECRDPHPHAVDPALVERVRRHFHRDVRRARVGERAQLAMQRDDIRRGQRPALHRRRETVTERAEVGAATPSRRPRRREARRRWSFRSCR